MKRVVRATGFFRGFHEIGKESAVECLMLLGLQVKASGFKD